MKTAPNAESAWLKGITLLDLSSLLPCPFTAHMMAKFGAKVLKIESPTRPDPARWFGYVPPDGVSSCYKELNENKELVPLDLKNESDRKKLYELVKHSDGAIQGYRPDVCKRLGIEYETFNALNPRFVYCSVSGYRLDRTHKERAGHDINFVARSGILDQTRDESGMIVPLGLPIADYLVGYSAALRWTAALMAARTTGKGSHVLVSIEEALLEVQRPFLRESEDSKEYPTAGETLVTGKFPCYGIYQLKDGAFALGALEEKFWILFCETIGHRELIPDQHAVGEKRDQVRKKILTTLSKKSFSEWKTIFSSIDCCIEPVLNVKEALENSYGV